MGINLGALIGPILVGWFATWLGYKVGLVLPAVAWPSGSPSSLDASFNWADRGAAEVTAAPGRPSSCSRCSSPRWRRGHERRAVDQRGRGWPPALWAMGVLGLGYFIYLLFLRGAQRRERSRTLVMMGAVRPSVMSGRYEQTGASFNLFAERYNRPRHLRLGNGRPLAAGGGSAVSYPVRRCSRRCGSHSAARAGISNAAAKFARA